jgi:hypothetical protein
MDVADVVDMMPDLVDHVVASLEPLPPASFWAMVKTGHFPIWNMILINCLFV